MYQRARSKEQISERKKSIIKAMDALYMKKELANIFLKEVADLAGLSRTAIYSYYSRKEEILLDSLYNHFINLDNTLELALNEFLSEDTLVDLITKALEENIIILKIMSSNLEDIEKTTTLDALISLKTELKKFQEIIKHLLSKTFPNANSKDIDYVLYLIITMLYGYYPVTNPIEIQRKAMELTKTTLNTNLTDLITTSLKFLFNNLK